MRFNWRRRLVVTAFAAVSLLPFTGCSSQQQQATEEVAAEGQGQEEGNAEAGGENANAEGGGENAVVENGEGNPVEGGDVTNGQNVVTDNTASNTGADGSANGDLQEIISEMSGPVEGQAATADAGSQAAPVTEAAPVDASMAAAPAPVESAPMADTSAPSGPSAAPGMPELGSKMGYVVEPGDTLGKIAAKIYGDQKRWRDIAGLSGLDNPNHIYPGDLVYYSLDEASKTFATNYEGIRRSKEIVRQGDTLASIAKRVYGKSNLWKHIWRQNDNIDNPDELSAGMAVYYVNRDSIKTTFNKIKNNTAKTASAASKNIIKTVHLMTQVYTAMPTLG